MYFFGLPSLEGRWEARKVADHTSEIAWAGSSCIDKPKYKMYNAQYWTIFGLLFKKGDEKLKLLQITHLRSSELAVALQTKLESYNDLFKIWILKYFGVFCYKQWTQLVFTCRNNWLCLDLPHLNRWTHKWYLFRLQGTDMFRKHFFLSIILWFFGRVQGSILSSSQA